VESGSAATPYVTQKPCEVALSTSGPGNVQFVDQPPSVTWAAVNVPAGARLRSCSVNLYSRNLALLDLYGGVTQLRDIPLKSGALESGQLNYLPDSPNELGVHRLEAWVAGADGTELSPRVEIVINRIHRPRYWNADAPNSPFGTHLESNSRDILAAKAIGMNWTRLHDAGLEYIGWYYLEPQKGNWQFRDADLNRYRKYGLKIMGELSTAPLWASTLTTQHNGYFDKFYEPKNLDDYANYVRTVTARYKGVIDTYEIWNEPWGSGYFPVAYDASAGTGDDEQRAYKHSATPELDYANLMKSAYAAAKVADPSVTILGFNTTTGDTGKNWTQGVLDGGGLDGCDVISYHHYFGGASAFPGDQVEEGYAHAFGPITAKLGQIPKPVVLSEGNGVIGLPQGDGFYNHTLPYPNTEPVEQVADDLCRYEVSLLGLGVKRTFLYTMASRNFFGQDLKWSVLLNADDSLSPSAAAFSNLAWLLEDTQFVRRDEIAPGVYAYLFQGTLAGHPRAVAVISRRPGQGQYTLPLAKSVSFTDLWGNPVTTGTSLGDTLDYAELAGPGETVDTLSKDLRVPTHD